jgi:hypothetical protein
LSHVFRNLKGNYIELDFPLVTATGNTERHNQFFVIINARDMDDKPEYRTFCGFTLQEIRIAFRERLAPALAAMEKAGCLGQESMKRDLAEALLDWFAGPGRAHWAASFRYTFSSRDDPTPKVSNAYAATRFFKRERACRRHGRRKPAPRRPSRRSGGLPCRQTLQGDKSMQERLRPLPFWEHGFDGIGGGGAIYVDNTRALALKGSDGHDGEAFLDSSARELLSSLHGRDTDVARRLLGIPFSGITPEFKGCMDIFGILLYAS